MTVFQEAVLIVLFFVTSAIGVVTGSNSLITVPVMFQFGIDPKVAVATNMFGLTFMSVGASIPFIRRGTVSFGRITPLIGLTLISSALGALIAGSMSNNGLKLLVTAAMIIVALFILFKRDAGVGGAAEVSRSSAGITFALAFLLGIYGGLYSGGYVTVLTAVLVAFFAMNFGEAVAATKIINVFSSTIATIVFMWQGLVDYRLGLILGATMFAGAFVGAHFAASMNDIWLRRIFLAAVFLLAVKSLFDFL